MTRFLLKIIVLKYIILNDKIIINTRSIFPSNVLIRKIGNYFHRYTFNALINVEIKRKIIDKVKDLNYILAQVQKLQISS